MSVLDLKTELNRMIEEREGVSDDTFEYKIHKDINSLKTSLKEMIEVRSGNMKLNRRLCENHEGTICPEHTPRSHKDLLGDSLSIGDIDRALNLLTYCTCNSRQAPGCVCQTNKKKDYCLCMTRNTLYCYCQSRNGGKYGHPCACHTRETVICSCQGRTSSLNCTCDGRCSCNVQKVFSQTPKDKNCECNTKIVEGCTCNTYTTKECTYQECSCVSRTATLMTVIPCSCNGYEWRWDCPQHTLENNCSQLTGDHPCPQNAWNVPGISLCDNDVNNINYEVSTCLCMNRCSCNTKAVMK